MAKTGRSARMKGINFERNIAERFRTEIGIFAERWLKESQPGHRGRDVDVAHFNVQCKAHAKITRSVLLEAFRQAISGVDAEHPVPVVFLKEDQRSKESLPECVCMRADDFFTLVKEWNDGERLK